MYNFQIIKAFIGDSLVTTSPYNNFTVLPIVKTCASHFLFFMLDLLGWNLKEQDEQLL